MGLEENINQILQLTQKISQSFQLIQDPSQIATELNVQLQVLQEKFKSDFGSILHESKTSFHTITTGVETSVNDLSMQLTIIQDKFRTDLESVFSEIQNSLQNLGPETLSSIGRLTPVLKNLEESFTELSQKFERLTTETKADLKFIKVSYVEDVVGTIRNLSKEVIDTLTNATDRTNNLYKASVDQFVVIDDMLKNISSSLNSLIENQTDQLATVAELRDRVNAIIQVELSALKDRITIYLESSVNELKTSVTERLAIQDETIRKLAEATQQMSQTIAALPKVLSQEINTAVETKVVTELASMKKEMRKLTAVTIKAAQRVEEGGNCSKCKNPYKTGDIYCSNCGSKLV